MRHVSYAQALEAAVFEEMQRDSKVYYMGEDVGVFGGAISKMYSLFQTFPERVMDMPLDEKGFTGIAVGMAWMGLRPIVEFMYPDFLVLAIIYGRPSSASGPWTCEDVEFLQKLCNMGFEVTATGGITYDDLDMLAGLPLFAVICGRSIRNAKDPAAEARRIKARMQKLWA